MKYFVDIEHLDGTIDFDTFDDFNEVLKVVREEEETGSLCEIFRNDVSIYVTGDKSYGLN